MYTLVYSINNEEHPETVLCKFNEFMYKFLHILSEKPER